MPTMVGDRLVIANKIPELRRMTQWLWTCGAAAGIPHDLLYKLDVCANEAVMNIISYAYSDSLSHDITLELQRTANGASIVIKDDGRPFNVLGAAEHLQPQSLAEARIGGLGIQLIRRLITRCDYKREDGLNVFCLEAHHSLRASSA